MALEYEEVLKRTDLIPGFSQADIDTFLDYIFQASNLVHSVPPVLRAVKKDFDKQFIQARTRPDLPHFVVMVLYGQSNESEQWRLDTLCRQLAESRPEMTLEWTFAAESMTLNRADPHTEMILVSARVGVAAPLALTHSA